MKIRNGFVSNSSSTSYTCDICGENEVVYDGDITELGMVECENRHTFCITCAPEAIQEEISEQDPYEIPIALCPICNLKEFTTEDLVNYLLKDKYKITDLSKCNELIEKNITDRFNSYDDFINFSPKSEKKKQTNKLDSTIINLRNK